MAAAHELSMSICFSHFRRSPFSQFHISLHPVSCSSSLPLLFARSVFPLLPAKLGSGGGRVEKRKFCAAADSPGSPRGSKHCSSRGGGGGWQKGGKDGEKGVFRLHVVFPPSLPFSRTLFAQVVVVVVIVACPALPSPHSLISLSSLHFLTESISSARRWCPLPFFAALSAPSPFSYPCSFLRSPFFAFPSPSLSATLPNPPQFHIHLSLFLSSFSSFRCVVIPLFINPDGLLGRKKKGQPADMASRDRIINRIGAVKEGKYNKEKVGAKTSQVGLAEAKKCVRKVIGERWREMRKMNVRRGGRFFLVASPDKNASLFNFDEEECCSSTMWLARRMGKKSNRSKKEGGGKAVKSQSWRGRSGWREHNQTRTEQENQTNLSQQLFFLFLSRRLLSQNSIERGGKKGFKIYQVNGIFWSNKSIYDN